MARCLAPLAALLALVSYCGSAAGQGNTALSLVGRWRYCQVTLWQPGSQPQTMVTDVEGLLPVPWLALVGLDPDTAGAECLDSLTGEAPLLPSWALIHSTPTPSPPGSPPPLPHSDAADLTSLATAQTPRPLLHHAGPAASMGYAAVLVSLQLSQQPGLPPLRPQLPRAQGLGLWAGLSQSLGSGPGTLLVGASAAAEEVEEKVQGSWRLAGVNPGQQAMRAADMDPVEMAAVGSSDLPRFMGLAVLAAEFQLHSLMALGCALLTPWATAQHPPAPPFPSPSANPPPHPAPSHSPLPEPLPSPQPQTLNTTSQASPALHPTQPALPWALPLPTKPGQRAALAVAAAALALATEQGWALQPDQGLVAPGVVLVRSGVSDGQYIQAVLRRAGADLGLAEMPGDELLEAVASLAADLAYLLEQDKQAALLGASLAPGAAFTPFSSPPPPSPVNDRSEALDRSSNSSDNAINGLLQLRGHSLALSPWADAANPVTLVTRVAGATRLLARAVAAVRRAGRVGMAADDASALLQPFSTASLPTMMAEQEGVCEGDVQVALGLGAPPAAVGMRTGLAMAVGPLLGCQGAVQGAAPAAWQQFGTSSISAVFSVNSSGPGTVSVWALPGCLDALTQQPLPAPLAAPLPPTPMLLLSPLSLLARGLRTVAGTQGPAAESGTWGAAAAAAMGLGLGAQDTLDEWVGVVEGVGGEPAGAAAASGNHGGDDSMPSSGGGGGGGSGGSRGVEGAWVPGLPPSLPPPAAAPPLQRLLRQPLVLAASAANAQLLAFCSLARALFSRSALLALALEDLEAADRLVTHLAMTSLAAEAQQPPSHPPSTPPTQPPASPTSAPTPPRPGPPTHPHITPLDLTSAPTLQRLLARIKPACFTDPSAADTPPPLMPSPHPAAFQQPPHLAFNITLLSPPHPTPPSSLSPPLVTPTSAATPPTPRVQQQQQQQRQLRGSFPPNLPPPRHQHRQMMMMLTGSPDFDGVLAGLASALAGLTAQLQVLQARCLAAAGGPVAGAGASPVGAMGAGLAGEEAGALLLNISVLATVAQTTFYSRAMAVLEATPGVGPSRSQLLQDLSSDMTGARLMRLAQDAASPAAQAALCAMTGTCPTLLPAPPPSRSAHPSLSLVLGLGLGLGGGCLAALLGTYATYRCRQEQQVMRSMQVYAAQGQGHGGVHAQGQSWTRGSWAPGRAVSCHLTAATGKAHPSHSHSPLPHYSAGAVAPSNGAVMFSVSSSGPGMVTGGGGQGHSLSGYDLLAHLHCQAGGQHSKGEGGMSHPTQPCHQLTSYPVQGLAQQQQRQQQQQHPLPAGPTSPAPLPGALLSPRPPHAPSLYLCLPSTSNPQPLPPPPLSPASYTWHKHCNMLQPSFSSAASHTVGAGATRVAHLGTTLLAMEGALVAGAGPGQGQAVTYPLHPTPGAAAAALPPCAGTTTSQTLSGGCRLQGRVASQAAP